MTPQVHGLLRGAWLGSRLVAVRKVVLSESMNEKITAAEFAAARGLPESAVVHRIKTGIYDGAEEQGVWYVLRHRPSRENTSAPDEPTREPARRRPVATKKVAQYTSRVYVNSIMILLGGLVLADFVALLFGGESDSLRGVGLRIGVIVMLWTQHRWARLAVQVWAGILVVAGGSGLFVLFSADPAEYTVAWWGPLLFGSFVVVGFGYLLTAHRYIKVDEVPA